MLNFGFVRLEALVKDMSLQHRIHEHSLASSYRPL
jgi:hypothetical protein